MKKICIVVLTVLFLASLWHAIPAKALIRYDNAPSIDQLKDNWCWAAAAEMLAKCRKSNSYDQTQIVYFMFGDYRDVAENVYETARAAKWATGYTSNFVGVDHPLDFNSVFSALGGNWAVACLACNYYGAYAHYYVIKTADDSDNSIYLYEPSPYKDNFWTTWYHFVNEGIITDDTTTWHYSVY